MRKLLLLGASALLRASLTVDYASAQQNPRGGGMGIRAGGFGGGGIGMRGGGFRGGFGGGHFRGGMVGGGFRGGHVWAGRGGGFVQNPGWGARRVAWGGPGWGTRRVGWGGYGWNRRVAWHRSGWGYRRAAWRHGWGWGVPVAAAGLTFATAATYGYSDYCWRWNGFEWVNVCYQPSYYYGYDPYW